MWSNFRWRRFFGACLLVVLAVVIVTVLSPPGCESTIVQKRRPKPDPVRPVDRPVDPMELLRSRWDSNADADWPVAELLASMSLAAYLPPVSAKPEFRKLGFEDVETVEDTSMIGYVAWTDDITVIVFRGTNSGDASDWVVNLNNRSISTPHGDMHRGFSRAYQALKPQIVTLLERNAPKHLWIAGHSLGGALALACAYDVVEEQKRPLDGVITFGQPMVARRQLADHLGAVLLGRYAHYVNDGDIVPRIPPGFRHCGSLVWFKADGIHRSIRRRVAATAVGPGDRPTAEAVYVDEGDEIIPLTEQEFAQVKANLQTERPTTQAFPNAPAPTGFTVRPIADHSMDLYLEKIRTVTRGFAASDTQ